MKKVIVTTSWDDGHRLDLKLASLLKKYELAGTFYISPHNQEFNKNELLNNEQVVALSRGFEIGAHTLTHPRLDKLAPITAKREIKGSKRYLEQIIKKPVTSFCYPGGYYTATHVGQVKNAGFNLARTTSRFSLDNNKNFYELPTSLQAYDHWLDAGPIVAFSRFDIFKFITYYRRWDRLAKAMFDSVLRHGGIFHIWGHSWELEKNRDWQRLETVFKYIAGRPYVKYLNNGELI